MPGMIPLLKGAYWTLAAGTFAYLLLMLALTNVDFQRNAFYINKVNPLIFPWPFRTNLDDFEQYGFLNKQVTPFDLKTYDGETLAAYHILPLDLYHEHEKSLFLQPHPHAEKYDSSNVTSSYPVSLLAKNPNAKVVINCHGNAAHAFAGHRPALLRALVSHSTPQDPVHLFTFDYRGFGLSTGSPTEEGLITDLLTLLQVLTSPPFSIPSSNIVLVSQSLGTAVASATAHTWAFNTTHPANPRSSSSDPLSLNLILMSSFTNVKDLLATYRFQGKIPPFFAPLKPYPRARQYLESKIVDTWNTSSRIYDLVSMDWSELGSFQLSIMHAKDDLDIPWLEGMGNWRSAMKAAGVIDPNSPLYEHDEQEQKLNVINMGEDGGHILKQWSNRNDKSNSHRKNELNVPETGLRKLKKGDKVVTWERALFGEHNSVGLQEWGRLAVKRVLDRIS